MATAKDRFKQLYRTAGFYEGAVLTELANDGPKVKSGARAHTRDQVPLADSDSTDAGDPNFFLLSPWGAPAPAGYWPWII